MLVFLETYSVAFLRGTSQWDASSDEVAQANGAVKLHFDLKILFKNAGNLKILWGPKLKLGDHGEPFVPWTLRQCPNASLIIRHCNKYQTIMTKQFA